MTSLSQYNSARWCFTLGFFTAGFIAAGLPLTAFAASTQPSPSTQPTTRPTQPSTQPSTRPTLPPPASGFGLPPAILNTLKAGYGQLKSAFSTKDPYRLPSPSGESTLNTQCRNAEKGDKCGSCEKGLQKDFDALISSVTQPEAGGKSVSSLKPGTTLEGFLGQAAKLMKAANKSPTGKVPDPNELNYLVIGNSQSAQGTKPGKPRIAIRSPNSELWLTFNTDPESENFNKIEIMRWNGPAGRYDFQEIAFPDARMGAKAGLHSPSGHFDAKPESCARCHGNGVPDAEGKQALRPIWDSYRAWAGVIPPRDDLLETDPPPTSESGFSGTMPTQEMVVTKTPYTANTPVGKYHIPIPSFKVVPVKPRNLDPYARSYFRFLDKVAEAKEGRLKDDPAAARLALLEVPYRSPNKSMEPTQKVAALRKELLDNGFIRIPHHPESKLDLSNQNNKSAEYSGSSQNSFDQLLSQQSCRIANDLWSNPKSAAYRFAVAGLVKCDDDGSIDAAKIAEYVPKETLDRINAYWAENRSVKKQMAAHPGLTPFQAVLNAVSDNHNSANEYKYNRAQKMLEGEIGLEGHRDPSSVTTEASKFSRKIQTPTYSRDGKAYVAISDPGGVAGVGESDTNRLAALTYLLEPMGIKPGRWSLTQGENPSEPNWAFSDQFGAMIGQQNWLSLLSDGTLQNGVNCSNMASRSKDAFIPAAVPAVTIQEFASVNNPVFAKKCQELVSKGAPDNMLLMGEAMVMQNCATCHFSREKFAPSDEKDFSDFTKADASQRRDRLAAFRDFLNAPSPRTNAGNGKRISYYELALTRLTGDGKMNLAAYGKGKPTMPPLDTELEAGPWKDHFNSNQDSLDFYKPAMEAFLRELAASPSVDAYVDSSVSCEALYGKPAESKEHKHDH